MSEPTNQKRVIEHIRAVYEDTLVPLALQGLQKMFLPDESAFCEIARADSRQKLILSGISLRYTAMSLIGLTLQDSLGRTTDLPLKKISDRLVSWCADDISLGDGGLVLWALALRNDPRTDQVARTLVDRAKLLNNRFFISSMALGWLLSGLSVAIQKQLGPPELPHLAERIYNQLMLNKSEKTGLFSLATPLFRKNILAARVNALLGSFASQVYPIIGLSCYTTAQKYPEALKIAQHNADQLCRLQGAQGQWWWIYHVKTAQPVIKYPVYSVHQDAMGPMALLAVRLAGASVENQLSAVEKSLTWIENHTELPEKQLIDNEISVVWRAIQRDNPARSGGFGLGWGERFRMNLAAWLGGPDKRMFKNGYICKECRPYHLGWILFAAAQAVELGDAIK